MNSAQEIINLLGRDHVMTAMQVKTQTVSDAIRDGRFPARWYRGIKTLMAEAGHDAPPMEAFAWRPFKSLAVAA